MTFSMMLVFLQGGGGAAKAAWAEVQNQYQRRADLVPNLVATVQGYAKQEKDVLTQVTESARPPSCRGWSGRDVAPKALAPPRCRKGMIARAVLAHLPIFVD